MELNKVYCMDNLELLKQMEDESVDLIYCDILYNTGKKFKDYDDRLGTPQQAMDWYRPRLIEMKRVLKDTGSVYLQCDYRLVHYLKVEMDNIFGIKNFRNEIIWCYSGGGVPKKDFAPKHDNILRYSKSNSYTFNLDEVREPYSDSVSNSNPSRFNKSYRGNAVYDGYSLNPLGKHPNDWWKIQQLMPSDKKERVGYDTQKPKSLLERIIKASSNENDIVADFFCGSGTSLVVAKELGRNYIGCDISSRAIEITNQRLSEI